MFKKIAAGSGLLGLVGAAQAAVPTVVTDGIATAQTDAVTVAGLMIGVVAALLAFKLIRREVH